MSIRSFLEKDIVQQDTNKSKKESPIIKAIGFVLAIGILAGVMILCNGGLIWSAETPKPNIFTIPFQSIDEVAKYCSTPKEIGTWLKFYLTYTPDPKDIWQSAEETFQTKKGDCEDYAILAKEILKRKGIDSQVIHFIFTLDGVIKGHAVCAFKENGKYNYISTSGYQASQVDDLKGVALHSMGRVSKYADFDYLFVYTDNDIKNFIKEGLKKRNVT
jgi:hypothetical protein